MIDFKTFMCLKELFDNDLGSNDLNPIHASLPRLEIQMRNFDESIWDDDPGVLELHKELVDHYKPDKFAKTEARSFRHYTGNSTDLNGRLWEDYKNKTETKNSDISRLDKIINSHEAPKSFRVFSSTRHNPEKLKNSEGLVHHPAYLSTSIKRSVATMRDVNSQRDQNGNEHLHVIHMDIPQGHAGVYIAHPNTSYCTGEREFLLPRGMNLKHIGTQTSKPIKGYDPHNDRENKLYIHMHHMEIPK